MNNKIDKISTHSAFVVPVKLEKHPNADNLSIVGFDGFTICVRTEDWTGIEKGIHIQPDSIVDTRRTEFSFLSDGKQDKIRVRAKKMRGIVSYGFLLPAKDGKIGEDYAEKLGVEHYDPPIQGNNPSQNNISAPPGYFSKYDIDNMRKYHKILKEGELVGISEKIHGAFFRCTFSSIKNEMYVGSKQQWKEEVETCPWWKAFRQYPQIEQFCREYPDFVLCGEIFGQVQNLKYGKSGVDLVTFDIRKRNLSWCNVKEFLGNCVNYGIPTVPIIELDYPFNFENILSFSNGPSLIKEANHHREGCVVKPMEERTDNEIGRVILKLVGETYLLNKKG